MQKKRKLSASFAELPKEKEEFNRSWRTGSLSDWTLVLGPNKFRVHKVLVATGERASAFLAASLRNNFAKREQTDITDIVPRQCHRVFETLLDFIYDADISLTVENWAPMMKLADALQVGSLYTKCIEIGPSLITADSAPRIVQEASELQLGGELQLEVEEIALDEMTNRFTSYSASSLQILPTKVLRRLLVRDDLEVQNEDQVFDFLVDCKSLKQKAEMAELWSCCRLHLLSPERVLEIGTADDIPRELIAQALYKSRLDDSEPRGREITLFVPCPGHLPKSNLYSPAHALNDRFSWSLFVLGSDTLLSKKRPREQLSAFIQITCPASGSGTRWTMQKVEYEITLVNFLDEGRSIRKQVESADFSATTKEADQGWLHWLPMDKLLTEQGWRNSKEQLCFRGRLCVRNSLVTVVHDELRL